MRWYTWILAVGPLVLAPAAGLLVAAGAPEDETDRELERLQGTWRTVSMVIDGRRVPDEEIAQRRVILIDNRYVIVDGNRTIQRGSYRIDPTRNPKQIDTMPADGPNKGKVDRGIYQLSGNILRLCYAPPDEDRPTEFAAEPGSRRWLAIDERVPEP